MTIPELLHRFDPSPPELRSILLYVRDRSRNIGAALLDGEAIAIPFTHLEGVSLTGLEVQYSLALSEDQLAPLEIEVGGRRIGVTTSGVHADLQSLLAVGVNLEVIARVEASHAVLEVRIVEPRDEADLE